MIHPHQPLNMHLSMVLLDSHAYSASKSSKATCFISIVELVITLDLPLDSLVLVTAPGQPVLMPVLRTGKWAYSLGCGAGSQQTYQQECQK